MKPARRAPAGAQDAWKQALDGNRVVAILLNPAEVSLKRSATTVRGFAAKRGPV